MPGENGVKQNVRVTIPVGVKQTGLYFQGWGKVSLMG